MGKRDPRVDAYIKEAAPFARPILKEIRDTVHAACPGVEETMKWRFPHFMYQGMLCGMAAFKQHAAFGFWKGSLVVGAGTGGRRDGAVRPRHQKIRAAVTSRARGLRQEGRRVERAGRQGPARCEALGEGPDRGARGRDGGVQEESPRAARFRGASPSHRREYLEWITEAKTEETRRRRLEQAIAWIAEGKSRNWKYERM